MDGYILDSAEEVGKYQPRKDLNIIPETEENKQIQRDAYNKQQEELKDPIKKEAMDKACEEWNKGFDEYCIQEQKYRESLWAKGIPTFMLPLGMGYSWNNPYPKLYDPDHLFDEFLNCEFNIKWFKFTEDHNQETEDGR